MRGGRQSGSALVFALVSAGLVIGGLALSVAEQRSPVEPLLAASATGGVTARPSVPAATTTPHATPLPAVVVAASTATGCPGPAGWTMILVQYGDSLSSLAARYRTSLAALRQANCLVSESLLPSTALFVPPLTTGATAACTPGLAGWSRSYVVAPGDTVYRISLTHSITTAKLKSVNCRSSDALYAGEVLWVPFMSEPPVQTSVSSADSLTPQPTDPLTGTPLPFTGTPLPFTATPSPTQE